MLLSANARCGSDPWRNQEIHRSALLHSLGAMLRSPQGDAICSPLLASCRSHRRLSPSRRGICQSSDALTLHLILFMGIPLLWTKHVASAPNPVMLDRL